MRTGVWLVGARGSVAVTSIVGALALRAGLAEPTGCVTELPELRSPALPGLGDLVFGGHDVATTPLVQEGRGAGRRRCRAGAGWSPRSPTSWPRSRRSCGRCRRLAPRRDGRRAIAADLAGFRDRHDLDRVVVVNVVLHRAGAASRTPRTPTSPRCEAALDEPDAVLPPSSLYAYAAFTRRLPLRGLHAVDRRPAARAGRSWPARPACRTPGTTARPARRWSSRCSRRCSRMRNLRVRTWSGINLLGGGDGANLAEPGRQRRQDRQQAAGARPRRSATARRAAPASSTSTTSATSRPPGT